MHRCKSMRAHHKQVRLGQYAWANRQTPTHTEAALWEALRGRRLGVAFRRQVVLGSRYIVDFLAPVVRLVVEVDGAYHLRRGRQDARRDTQLAELGYRVVRLDAKLVAADLPEALRLVREALSR